jgi:hypothetical protein
LFRRLQTRLVDRQCEIEDYLLAPLKGVTQSKCRPVRIPGFKEWIEPLQTNVRRNGDSAYSRAFFLDARIFRHFILSSLDGYGRASTSKPLDYGWILCTSGPQNRRLVNLWISPAFSENCCHSWSQIWHCWLLRAQVRRELRPWVHRWPQEEFHKQCSRFGFWWERTRNLSFHEPKRPILSH